MEITMFCKDCGHEIRGQFAATCISCVKSAAQPEIERGIKKCEHLDNVGGCCKKIGHPDCGCVLQRARSRIGV
jgi:hypothetical protein